MPQIEIPNGWEPRPYQMPLWMALQSGKRRAIELAHRRWGKDDVALHWANVAAHERPASYWHCLPEYAQCRKAIWTSVNPRTGKRRIDEAFPQELRESTNEQEMLIRFKCGSTWQLVGSDRYDSLVGAGVAGVTFSEWALANPSAWPFISPMLEENNGWALFITTTRGENHATQMHDDGLANDEWFAETSTVADTKAFSPEQVQRIESEWASVMGGAAAKALIQQEYYLSRIGVTIGAYYQDQFARIDEDGRIGSVPYDRTQLVHTAWDLGYSDATAIWFLQICGQEVHAIDYYEASSRPLEHYVDVLRERGYRYGEHYFPHDVAAHELTTGKSRVDVLQSLDVSPLVGRMHHVQDGINATRVLLDKMWIDKDKCARGIQCLRMYAAKFDEKKRIFMPHPDHNEYSHGADALRTFAAGWDGIPTKTRRGKYEDRPERRSPPSWMAV